jgi:hypothetical protein
MLAKRKLEAPLVFHLTNRFLFWHLKFLIIVMVAILDGGRRVGVSHIIFLMDQLNIIAAPVSDQKIAM